ncbi:MAG: DegT/DnrJ/EryC1/StrS family aminotransferase [Ferruginibacter sp.]
MLNVTESFLPPFEEYSAILKRAWDKKWLTNNGELVQELEQKLKDYLGVKHCLFTTNGTIVLQMALKCLKAPAGSEVITTPFSYVATTNSILWEGLTPVFVDINNKDFCIDSELIESAITEKTVAILATHVYGNPCAIEKIEAIGKKYNIKIIYDAAHAFGATYKDRQILSYGNIVTCSFHATKVFHTVEGGCIITNDDEIANELYLMRQFGHIGDDYFSVGINGKNSEFHAAMGLANLKYVDEIIEKRKAVSKLYDEFLSDLFIRPIIKNQTIYNYAYYPIFFENEVQLLDGKLLLAKKEIFARRYFYPSLNKLPFILNNFTCSISEDYSRRALTLPLSTNTSKEEVINICNILNNILC